MRYVLLCLLLSGCATALVQVAEVSDSHITWIKVQPRVCDGDTKMQACAVTHVPFKQTGGTCMIVAANDASDETLGHEMRHCFGWVHY